MDYDWYSSLGMMSAMTAAMECKKLRLKGDKADEYIYHRSREVYKEEGIKYHYFTESEAEELS